MKEGRDPAVCQVLEFFEFQHLPGHLQAVSSPFRTIAYDMADSLPSDPEVMVGLRKLLEAKDCFVRAAVRVHTNGHAEPKG